jgi:hypothetical protein
MVLSVPVSKELNEKDRYLVTFIIDDEDCIENILFVECFPTEEYYTENRGRLYYDNFSGKANIYDADNKLLGSMAYYNGIRIQTKGIHDDKRQRTQVQVSHRFLH